jgi:nucleotide-binding universal stress UspA family protein
MEGLRSICCAVDFSEASRAALQEAATLARREGARLEVLHVERGPRARPEALLAPPPPPARHAGDLGVLGEWVAEAERLAGTPVRGVHVIGDPATEIARYAREVRSDLLVIGATEGFSWSWPLRRPVGPRLLRLAHCPVLAVPPDAARAA